MEEVDSLGVPYDLNSIMHYSMNTFAKSSSTITILPKTFFQGGLGQRRRLSPGDILQTKLLYKCPGLFSSIGYLIAAYFADL